jgi:type II secretory pathway pseudopilin PulG
MKAAVFNGKKSNNSGTTLVELITAILIFSIVMIGGMSFFVLGNQSFQRSKRVAFATQVGYEAIQKYSTQSWDNLQSIVGTAMDPGGITYKCATTVTPVTVGAMQTKNINTVVTWPGQTAAETVDFDTSISSPVVAQ